MCPMGEMIILAAFISALRNGGQPSLLLQEDSFSHFHFLLVSKKAAPLFPPFNPFKTSRKWQCFLPPQHLAQKSATSS